MVVAEEGTELPFDVADERTVLYVNDMEGTQELRPTLERHVHAAMADTAPDNPIYRVVESPLIHAGELKATDKYILEQLEQLTGEMRRANRDSTDWTGSKGKRRLEISYLYSTNAVSRVENFFKASMEDVTEVNTRLTGDQALTALVGRITDFNLNGAVFRLMMEGIRCSVFWMPDYSGATEWLNERQTPPHYQT